MYVLEYNGVKIEYAIERKKVKNINLRVKADGSVAVSASRSVPKSVIEGFVYQNADRILRAIEKINSKNAKLPSYESGDRIMLLGKEYTLQIIESDKSYYSIDAEIITFFVHNSDIYESREAVYKMLLLDAANQIFSKLIKECYPAFTPYCAALPKLKIKYLKSQWGNCYAGRNLITLNAKLAAYDENVIRFVINHEYCHFVHQNHSDEFYKLLTAVMPEWKMYDKVLKNRVISAG